MASLMGRVEGTAEGAVLIVSTDNVRVARRFYTLVKHAFDISARLDVIDHEKDASVHSYNIVIGAGRDTERVLESSKLMVSGGALECASGIVSPILIGNECCKRAFLRAAFLCVGSVSDPEKSYHFEMVCDTMEQASQLKGVTSSLSVTSGITRRKNRHVLYVKESDSIVDLLNLMGASTSLMNMENVRILKDMRNRVNRRVNCETANLGKTVDAASRQISCIERLRDTGALDGLTPTLVEMAYLRLSNPDASLKELGLMCDPPLGRSGVNHRLKKLEELADEL